MANKITSGDEMRSQLLKGIEKVATVVGTTMGPRGKNVILYRGAKAPIVTNDGVTVAKEVSLPDAVEDAGAALLIEAAEKTNSAAGDGTTTTVVLAHALCKEGLACVKRGMNPFKLADDLHFCKQFIVDMMKGTAEKVTCDNEKLSEVAIISAQDEEIGKMIASCFAEVGADGIVTVEDGMKPGMEKDVRIGMQFDSGITSPYFVTNPERDETVFDDAHVLLTDKKITSMKDIVKVLEQVSGEPLVIIADEIEGEALASLTLNKMRGVINVLPLRLPGVGIQKKELMFDIAAMTGAVIISEEAGLKLEDATAAHLGRVNKITSNKKNTIIVGLDSEKEDVETRIATIRQQIEKTQGGEKQMHEQRLAHLAGGVAVIKVGAATEMELKNKKYKIEDAILACKAAMEEGILSGGGITLFNIANLIPDVLDNDSQVVVDMVKNACAYPLKLICHNAGFSGDYVAETIKQMNDVTYGFNAKEGKFGDMIKMGIIDSVKCLRVSLENAVSASICFLTSEAVISDLSDKNK